ncbi:hypothetical protein BDAP_000623 [Binucleata daphniae]
MDNVEEQIEHLLFKSNQKTVLLQKLQSRIKKSDMKVFENKIDEITKNNPNASFDEIFNIFYAFVNENMPSYVENAFYADISEFVNEKIKFDV